MSAGDLFCTLCQGALREIEGGVVCSCRSKPKGPQMNPDVEALGEHIGGFFVREKLSQREILDYLREAAEMLENMIEEAEDLIAAEEEAEDKQARCELCDCAIHEEHYSDARCNDTGMGVMLCDPCVTVTERMDTERFMAIMGAAHSRGSR